jgi:hypothetical protein
LSRPPRPPSTWSSIGNGSGADALSTSTSVGDDLDLAGGRLGLALPSGAGDLAGDLEAVLAAQAVRDGLVADDDLDHAAGLAQVEERDAAVVAPAGHPPGERDGLADVLGAQGAGVMGADHWFSLSGVRVRDDVGRRSSAGVQVAGPPRPGRRADVLDLVACRRPGNQTYGMPRRSA